MSSTFAEIRNDIKNRRLAPIYFLHGEEGFYTDMLVSMFEQYLPEHERAFNLFLLYAIEKSPDDVMDIARRYPLMADKIVVIVKETQAVRGGAGKWINKLAAYAANPSPDTVLVVTSRGAKVACKEFTDALKKSKGVVFESAKIRDAQLSSAVAAMIKEAGLKYENKSVAMLADNIGNDLSRLYNEITKLGQILPPGSTVTPEAIEKNIGISREYNNFELTKALAQRDVLKAIKIIRHFSDNQRDNPWVLTLSAIFSLFSRALIVFYTQGDDNSKMAAIGTRSISALNESKDCLRNYTPSQLVEIIGLIRTADSNCKGNGSRLNPEDIMENLISQIFMAQGTIK